MNTLANMTNAEIAASNTTPEIIWGAAYERMVKAVDGFATYRRTPAMTMQPEDLPCLAIYLLGDREQALGNYNHGEPKFLERVTLGIAGMIAVTDVDAQLEWLANKVLLTRIALYTDPSFIELISGFEASVMKLVFERVGELPIAQYMMELTICFETIWPPLVLDDYLRLHLESRYPPPETDPNVRPQIIRKWDIEQN